jgi:hypothetical protein
MAEWPTLPALMRPRRNGRYLHLMPSSRALFDPGWLYLLSGLALLAATVLVPAHDDLARAEAQRAAVQARLDHAQLRLRRYADFIAAVDEEHPIVVRRLVATQLNLTDPDRHTVMVAMRADGADVTRWIEPEPVAQERKRLPETRLRRWATHPNLRPWLLGGAGFLILIGVFPAAEQTLRRRSSGDASGAAASAALAAPGDADDESSLATDGHEPVDEADDDGGVAVLEAVDDADEDAAWDVEDEAEADENSEEEELLDDAEVDVEEDVTDDVEDEDDDAWEYVEVEDADDDASDGQDGEELIDAAAMDTDDTGEQSDELSEEDEVDDAEMIVEDEDGQRLFWSED